MSKVSEQIAIHLGHWDSFIKVKFIGKYWKIALVLNIAEAIGLKTDYYSGGTGTGEL
jgi:hypothetical protein